MSYTKNTWNTGDIVTSEKLNRMEDGIASGENVFIVGGATYGDSGVEGTLDKTWQEIHDAMQSKICIVVITNGNNITQVLIASAFVEGGKYGVISATSAISATSVLFATDSANGYPAVNGVVTK